MHSYQLAMWFNSPKNSISTKTYLRMEFFSFRGWFKKSLFFHTIFCLGDSVWSVHVIAMWTTLYLAIRRMGVRIRAWYCIMSAKTRSIFRNGKKRFHVRKEANLKHTLEFCILGQITFSKINFWNTWFSSFNHFCVFYTNLLLYVGKKKTFFLLFLRYFWFSFNSSKLTIHRLQQWIFSHYPLDELLGHYQKI